ncbi:hypothetical protein GGF50DRAFT_119604 [Schizophyllum commune]
MPPRVDARVHEEYTSTASGRLARAPTVIRLAPNTVSSAKGHASHAAPQRAGQLALVLSTAHSASPGWVRSSREPSATEGVHADTMKQPPPLPPSLGSFWKDHNATPDLSEMTYEEIVLCVPCSTDWIRHVEERVAGLYGTGDEPSLLQSHTRLDDPTPFVEVFFAAYPLVKERPLVTEDTAYFLAICRRSTQKLVPSIPVLDEQVEFRFQKGPQRVCFIQDPVSVKWSTVKDEPIEEHFRSVNSTLNTRLLERTLGNNESKAPVVNHLASRPKSVPSLPFLKAGGRVVFHMGALVISTVSWLESFAGGSCVDNFLCHILVPRPHRKVVDYTSDVPSAFGTTRSLGISLNLFKQRCGVLVPLRLESVNQLEQGFALIQDAVEGRDDPIKAFRWKLWYSNGQALPNINVRDFSKGAEVVIKAEDCTLFTLQYDIVPTLES